MRRAPRRPWSLLGRRLRPGVTAGLFVLAVVLGSAPGAAIPRTDPTADFAQTANCSAGLTIVAVPTNGPAPLLVEFTLLLPNLSGTRLTWSFGDGGTVSGTNGSGQSLAHLYSSAGEYTAAVYATAANGTLSCSIVITATQGELQAHVALTPSSGPVPLTVHFTGSASNGTDTYNELVWDFGDGGKGAGVSLNYTYRTEGAFTVTLRVVDSSGASAVATARVVALPDPAASGSGHRDGPWEEVASLPLWVWAGTAALVTTAIGVTGVRLLSRATPRLAGARRPAAGNGDAPPSHAPLGPSPPPGPTQTSETAPAYPPGEVVPAVLVAAPNPKRTSVSLDSLRLSQRIVIHLGRYGVIEPEGSVRREFTQKGMAEGLQVRQGPLSNVLRRLVAAGVLTEELRHVRGAPRRIKAYRLTSEGLALSRELRSATTGSRETREPGSGVGSSPQRSRF
jgi:hypothetical protein